MKPKPIIVIRVPDHVDMGIEDIREDFSSVAEDYHILIIAEERDDIDIDIFYEKDFNKVKYEELKRIIKDNYDK